MKDCQRTNEFLLIIIYLAKLPEIQKHTDHRLRQ